MKRRILILTLTVFAFVGVYFAAIQVLKTQNITVLWQRSVTREQPGSNPGSSNVGFSIEATATVRKHIINLLPGTLMFAPFPLVTIPIADLWRRTEKNFIIKLWSILGYSFAFLLALGNFLHVGFLYIAELLILPLIFLSVITPLILLGVIYGKRQMKKQLKGEKEDGKKE